MKEKVFILEFNKPLEPNQEKYLIGQLQVVMEQAKKKLKKTAKNLKSGQVQLIAKTTGIPLTHLEFSANRIELMAERILDNFLLEKINPWTYRFVYKSENFSMGNIGVLGKQFKGDMINDKKIKDYIENRILPLMKKRKDEVKITVSEIDV